MDIEKCANKNADASSEEKGYRPGGNVEVTTDLTNDVHHHLHRGLKSRQVAMIAIGGAIGTGLIIGTGTPLRQAGPAPLVIGYTLVGFLCFLVMAALGEMAAWLPLPSGFTGYAHRFVDPAFGFSLGWNYWFKYIIVTPNNLTAFSLVIQYWITRDTINPGVFIAIALIAIILINYFGIKFFGEFEFWLSSIKVIIVLGLIILSLVLSCGGGPDHDSKGFRYWNNPGAFKEYLATGNLGRFLGFWSVLTTAVFAYLGTELVGVTVGECQNPRKVIPRAIKLTFYRIILFYIVLVFLLGMIVPYNSPDLIKTATATTSAAASPFVVAIQISGIQALPGIFNACILIFVFSAANSDLYIASRTLYSLAMEGNAPSIFKRTDARGVPIYALGFSSTFCLLAFLNVSTGSATVFGYFVNLVTIFGLLTWISILVSHIFFVNARRAQNIPDGDLAYIAPFGRWGSVVALFFCCLVAIFKGFAVFVYNPAYGNFDYKNFITNYLGIPIYLAMILGYKLVMKSKRVRPDLADMYGGKQRIDDEEAEFIAKQLEKNHGKLEGTWQKLYNNSIGMLF